MEKPAIIDKRPIKLEDITRAEYIPFLGGRPKRVTIITGDDIVDLKILLNTTSTVDQFLGRITSEQRV